MLTRLSGIAPDDVDISVELLKDGFSVFNNVVLAVAGWDLGCWFLGAALDTLRILRAEIGGGGLVSGLALFDGDTFARGVVDLA